MNRKNFKKEILEKIKEGKIEQKSKWYFLTKSYVFWVFTLLSTLLGAFAVASILFQLRENRRAFMVPEGPGNMAKGFMEALPHWWILAFLLLIVVAYINYKNTYKSYARESIYMIFISLLVSLVLGFIIFYTGLAKHVEHRTREFFPEYKEHIENRKQRVRNFLQRNGYTREDMQNPETRKEAMELLHTMREERKNR